MLKMRMELLASVFSEFGRGLCLKVMAKDSLYYLKMLPLNNY